MVDYSETVSIEVYDIKVGIYSKLNEYIEIYMYQRLRSFIESGSQVSDEEPLVLWFSIHLWIQKMQTEWQIV